jgi:hypothetical protein
MNDTSPNDALAAEYVLGTLDSEERTQTQALLVIDQELVGKVRLWERRLGELHLMVEPVEPDGKIWERIKAKMPARPEPESKPPEPPPAEAAPAPTPPSAAGPEAPPARPTQPPPSVGPDLGFRLPPAASLPRGSVPAPTPASAPAPAPVPAPTLAPVLTPRVIPPPSVAPQLVTAVPATPSVAPPADTVLPIRRRLTRWRAFAILMMLGVVAVGALIAAWRLVPERVPPVLQPAALMRLIGVTVAGSPPRRPAPPESQFDE